MKIVEPIATYLQKHNLITAELAPWFSYGLSRMLLSGFTYFVLLLLGWLLWWSCSCGNIFNGIYIAPSRTILMTTKKRISRVVAVALAMMLMMALAVPGFAAGTDVVTNCNFADTSHPFAFFTARTTSSKVINQYTTGQPVNGTRLTTWSWTGDPSQWFESAIFTANGSTGNAWAVYSNPNLVVNCRRLSGSPEVDVASGVGNYRADIEIFFQSGSKMSVAPRYVHTSNRNVTIGAAMSGGNYLNWTSSGSNLYQYDVGLKYFY